MLLIEVKKNKITKEQDFHIQLKLYLVLYYMISAFIINNSQIFLEDPRLAVFKLASFVVKKYCQMQ